ncbi:hypothetical protein ANANG_G00057760 [Anguilla anguilla]|uniref:Uncharacterized protein n=1 Tax=Anguilla anguilla TaxID=7936 RepID=A0A9D3S4R9_ANGAN|nr:hypothetical protein ANANG_G00057760 [Anguilla anguilla]
MTLIYGYVLVKLHLSCTGLLLPILNLYLSYFKYENTFVSVKLFYDCCKMQFQGSSLKRAIKFTKVECV